MAEWESEQASESQDGRVSECQNEISPERVSEQVSESRGERAIEFQSEI